MCLATRLGLLMQVKKYALSKRIMLLSQLNKVMKILLRLQVISLLGEIQWMQKQTNKTKQS